MSKKVLLIGNGARENAICKALKNSSSQVFSFANALNPSIKEMSEEVYLTDKVTNFKDMLDFAKKVKPDFAIIGPDDPIALGAADQLLTLGIKSVAPLKDLARLESSKGFTRKLLEKYNLKANPLFKVFTNLQGAKEFAEQLGQIVVKFDGLAGGKGVKVQGDHFETIDQGLDFAKQCLQTSDQVVIEEKLIGEEFSAMFFVDGKTVSPMPLIQDHKRAFENDQGPNTGGMGTISDHNHLLPFLKPSDLQQAQEITEKTMQALQKECGENFHGIMFGGFIATKNGVRLIEFNARFGDPEAMNALVLLQTNFTDICNAILQEDLKGQKIDFENKATVCKYVVPEGYPENPVKNVKIDINKSMIPKGVEVFYASVDQKQDNLFLQGSRAIAFVAKADNLKEAENLAEKACLSVKGPVFHRCDIGKEKLLQKRLTNIKNLRGSF